MDDLWVTDRTGMGTTAPYGLLQVGTLPTTPGLIVTTGNNVGIGTTNPKTKLEIIPADTSSGFYLDLAEAKLIMKSPDGTCSACGPNNSDAWSCASVSCP